MQHHSYSSQTCYVENLVVDANAIFDRSIVSVPKTHYKNLYCLAVRNENDNEIKDEESAEMIRSLLPDVMFKEPSDRSIKLVRDIATKTGDIRDLSNVDVAIAALVVDLGNVSWSPNTTEVVNTDGFCDVKVIIHPKNPRKTKTNRKEEIDNGIDKEPKMEGIVDTLDTERGWITPDNISTYGISSSVDVHTENDRDVTPKQKVRVACMTSDFSMQNVLIHMGFTILMKHGKLIKNVRVKNLRCVSCHAIESDMTKQFCRTCGRSVFTKVSVTLNPRDGSKTVHLSEEFHHRPKTGCEIPPDPKKGQKNKLYIVSEDQSEYIKQRNRYMKYQKQINKNPYLLLDNISKECTYLPKIGYARRKK